MIRSTTTHLPDLPDEYDQESSGWRVTRMTFPKRSSSLTPAPAPTKAQAQAQAQAPAPVQPGSAPQVQVQTQTQHNHLQQRAPVANGAGIPRPLSSLQRSASIASSGANSSTCVRARDRVNEKPVESLSSLALAALGRNAPRTTQDPLWLTLFERAMRAVELSEEAVREVERLLKACINARRVSSKIIEYVLLTIMSSRP